MHLKNRIERLKQTDNGKARLLMNIPRVDETWEEAQIRFERERAAAPNAHAIRIKFVKPRSSS